MKFKHTLALSLITATMALGITTSHAQSAATGLKVEAPWARPTVQGQAAGGGFLRIVGGPAGDKLVGASADIAARVELHTMSMDGNVMRMRQIDSIDVPASKAVDLAPGGLHVMFMDLKTPLKTGSSFPLTLKFERAGGVQVVVKVLPGPPGGAAAAKPAHTHKH
jgi:copper(I)-binding protein